MKHWFLIVLILLCCANCYAQDFTIYYNLETPSTGTTNWTSVFSADMTSIDATMKILSNDMAARNEKVGIISSDMAAINEKVGIISSDMAARNEKVGIISSDMADRVSTDAVLTSLSSDTVSADAISTDNFVILNTMYPVDTPADNEVVKYDSSLGRLNFESDATTATTTAFHVTNSGTQSNWPVGVATTISYDSERFDTGNDFASGTTYTAPVTGKYLLGVNTILNSVDSACSDYDLIIVTSNKSYEHRFDARLFAGDGRWSMSFSVLADMDANDTAHVTLTQADGTQQTGLAAVGYFYGRLVEE